MDSRWFGERSERSVETPHVGGRSSRNVRIEMSVSRSVVRIEMSGRNERSSVVCIESVRSESGVVRMRSERRSVVRIESVRNERSYVLKLHFTQAGYVVGLHQDIFL